MTPRRWLFAAAVLGALILHSRVVLVVFLAIAWMVCAWLWPFAPCFRCQGRKTNKGSTKKRFGPCKAMPRHRVTSGASGRRPCTGLSGRA